MTRSSSSRFSRRRTGEPQDDRAHQVADERPDVVFFGFLADFPPPEEFGGGLSVRPHEFFHAAVAEGHTVKLVAVRAARRRHRDGALQVRTMGHAPNPLFRELFLIPRMAVHLIRAVRAIRRSGAVAVFYAQVPTGIVMSSGWLPAHVNPGLLLFGLARRLGAHTWAAVHDISPDHQESNLQRRLQSGLVISDAEMAATRRSGRLMTIEQRWALRRSSVATVVSEGMRQAVVERCGLDPSRVVLFRAGVDPKLVESIPPWVPPAGRPWRIGYLGSVADADFSILLEALELVDHEVTLVLGGIGISAVAEAVRRRGLECEVHEGVAYADFAEFASAIDVWAVPYGDDPYYLEQASQLKVPMDVASGRPVVITGVPDVDEAGLAPYVYAAMAGAAIFAAAINEVCSDSTEAARRAAAGREFILASRTWRATARVVLDQAIPIVRRTDGVSCGDVFPRRRRGVSVGG